VYVETYVVKPDKMAEFAAYCKKHDALAKERPELFKEMKSFKRFGHLVGGKWGGITAMVEVEGWDDVGKLFGRLMQDKEYMTTLNSEWASIVVPGTDSISIWQPLP
jgi:hypothetical protein